MSNDTEIQTRSRDNGQRGAEPAITCGGEVTFENGDAIVRAVREALQREPAEITLDMDQVWMIDSAGLQAVLKCWRFCDEAHVKLRIAPISQCAARIVTMSGLARLLGIPPADLGLAHPHPPMSVDWSADGWKVYEYVAASDASVISILRERTIDAAVEAGAKNDTLCDIQIAVGEALTNAYRHGSPVKGTSMIKLRCLTCDRAFAVEIQDEGSPFDPELTPEPDPEQLPESGMGIFLMRQAMDMVEFCSHCPGNRVRMVKWLT